jgi:hypothetical protein
VGEELAAGDFQLLRFRDCLVEFLADAEVDAEWAMGDHLPRINIMSLKKIM